MTTTPDPRKAAEAHVQELIAIARQQAPGDARETFLTECDALAKAIAAFHMEGIRFRAYNVDRLIHKGSLALPPAAAELFARVRADLEAAGFHTRSHQSPV